MQDKNNIYASPLLLKTSKLLSCLSSVDWEGVVHIIKNSLIIHEENTKKNHKRVVSVYVIQIHVDLHKL